MQRRSQIADLVAFVAKRRGSATLNAHNDQDPTGEARLAGCLSMSLDRPPLPAALVRGGDRQLRSGANFGCQVAVYSYTAVTTSNDRVSVTCPRNRRLRRNADDREENFMSRTMLLVSTAILSLGIMGVSSSRADNCTGYDALVSQSAETIDLGHA
jgi:hypothetical protein